MAAIGLAIPANVPAPPAVALVQSSHGHPAFGTQNGCSTYVPVINARFILTGPFTAAERDLARAAFADWDAIRDNAGNPLYSSTEVAPGNHNVEVRRVPDGSGSNAPCSGATVNIDNPILRTFRHEIGHNHGLNHVGPSHDLMTGSDPTMDGCGSGTAIRADDHSNALYRRSSGRITANGGFENGINFGWSYLNNSGASHTSQPYQGVRSLNIPAGSVVSSQARVVSTPPTLRVRVAYKNFGTNSVYKFEYRGAQHAAGGPACGNFWTPANIRWDVAPAPGAWTKRLEVNLGTTSTWVTRDDAIPGPAPSQNYLTIAPNGIDYKITFTASNQASFVDNLEVYRG